MFSLLIKPVSGKCNLSCKYCFYNKSCEKRTTPYYGYMDYSTLENLVYKSLQISKKTCTFCFQGGEPTLQNLEFYKKLVTLQKKYNKNNVAIYNTIQTNLYEISLEYLEFLSLNNFLVGVSLDGVKETHDYYRLTKNQADTFDKVIYNIELLKKYKIEFNILTVINSKTVKIPKQIYDFYKNSNYTHIQFIPYIDIDERYTDEFSIDSESYANFLMTSFELWYKDYSQGKAVYISEFINYINILYGYPSNTCTTNGICTIQNVVEANGNIYPCDFYCDDHYLLGNINSTDFHSINNSELSKIFIEKSMNICNECLDCKYYAICKCGCNKYRINHKDSEYKINRFCNAYKLFFEYLL